MVTVFCNANFITKVSAATVTPSTTYYANFCIHGKRCYNDKKLIAGVGNYGNNKRYYWVDPNFSSNYKNRIYYAFNYWTYTSNNPGVTTSISIKESSLKSDSTFDINKGTISGTVTGFCDMYYYSDLVEDCSVDDWSWCNIYIDQSKTADFPNPQRVGLVAHEVGHGMGLSHNDSHPSIMEPYDEDRLFDDGSFRNRPSADDCKVINHLYG